MNQLINLLNEKFPSIKAVSTEEWNGNPDGIWFRGTESTSIDGFPILNLHVYDPEEKIYILGIHKKLQEILAEYGFYPEPYDSGTLMAWPV